MTITSIVRTPAGRIGTINAIEITDSEARVQVVFGTFVKQVEWWPHYLLRLAA